MEKEEKDIRFVARFYRENRAGHNTSLAKTRYRQTKK